MQAICFVRAFFIPFSALFNDINGIFISVYIFQRWQRGGEIMKLSSSEEIIRLQFNAYMMITIKGIVRYRRKQRARCLEREALFCEIPEIKQNSQSSHDIYSIDFSVFQEGNFSIKVSDEKLDIALRKLSKKQRNYILLYYFQDMRDREIAEFYHVSRSSVGCTRNKGLQKLQTLMNERK